jgi:hypothetical protein
MYKLVAVRAAVAAGTGSWLGFADDASFCFFLKVLLTAWALSNCGEYVGMMKATGVG